MKKILSAIAIMVAVVGLAYGGPMITGGAGGTGGTTTGADISGTFTPGNVVTSSDTNTLLDGGVAVNVIATSTSLAGYSSTSHNHTGVYATASSNVASASALAADPANCPSGWFPLGITAAGSAETCTQAVGAFLTTSSVPATASALAADPANCPAGYYALGITATGSAEGCTAAGAGTPGMALYSSLASGNILVAYSTNQAQDLGYQATYWSASNHGHTTLSVTSIIASGDIAAGSFTSAPSTDPTITLQDSDNAAGTAKIYGNSSGGANSITMSIGVEDADGENQAYVQLNGPNKTVDINRAIVIGAPTQTGSRGMHVLVTAGSTLAAGAIIYDSQSAVYASNTSSAYMAPYPLLAVAACNNGSTTCQALRFGYYRYAGVQGWSPGQTLYVASGYGSITTTAPTVTGYQLQIVGYAVDSITAWFQPSPTIIQLTN